MDKKWIRHTLTSNHKDAYRWAVHCCYQDIDMAQEILQDVYIKVLEGKAVYHGRSAFKTWLYSVIRFTALDALKKKSRLKWVGLDAVTNHVVESEAVPMKFDHLLNELSEKQREVLLLVFYHDNTLEAASEIMGCSLGTVRTHYHRGKEKLKEILTDYYEKSETNER